MKKFKTYDKFKYYLEELIIKNDIEAFKETLSANSEYIDGSIYIVCDSTNCSLTQKKSFIDAILDSGIEIREIYLSRAANSMETLGPEGVKITNALRERRFIDDLHAGVRWGALPNIHSVEGNEYVIEKIEKIRKSDSKVSPEGWGNLLIETAKSGNIEIQEYLLNLGEEISPDHMAKTLSILVKAGKKDMARELLNSAKKMNIKEGSVLNTDDIKTILSFSLEEGKEDLAIKILTDNSQIKKDKAFIAKMGALRSGYVSRDLAKQGLNEEQIAEVYALAEKMRSSKTKKSSGILSKIGNALRGRSR